MRWGDDISGVAMARGAMWLVLFLIIVLLIIAGMPDVTVRCQPQQRAITQQAPRLT